MLDAKLETLLAVAEYKSFTKAAEILSLTQPAVSNHINQLEIECNAKLFIRGKGEFKLTPEGEIAVTYAKRLKVIHKKMLNKIADEQKNISRFRIGITHSSENSTITEMLAKYVIKYPQITLTIITDTTNNLYEMLENYELDLAILEEKRPSTKLDYLSIDTDCLVCVLNNDNPLTRKDYITINELKKENLILRLPTSATRHLFEATLVSINESIDNFNVLLEVDNVSTIKELIRKNLGVSILPKIVCLNDVNKKKLSILPIENLSMQRDINMVYNKDFTNIKIFNDIVKLYQELIVNKENI